MIHAKNSRTGSHLHSAQCWQVYLNYAAGIFGNGNDRVASVADFFCCSAEPNSPVLPTGWLTFRLVVNRREDQQGTVAAAAIKRRGSNAPTVSCGHNATPHIALHLFWPGAGIRTGARRGRLAMRTCPSGKHANGKQGPRRWRFISRSEQPSLRASFVCMSISDRVLSHFAVTAPALRLLTCCY